GELVHGRHELLAGKRGELLRHRVSAYGRRMAKAPEDDPIDLTVYGPCHRGTKRAQAVSETRPKQTHAKPGTGGPPGEPHGQARTRHPSHDVRQHQCPYAQSTQSENKSDPDGDSGGHTLALRGAVDANVTPQKTLWNHT